MILKQAPEDFRVEELTDVKPSDGPFCLYRLEKSGWTTPDALQAIRRRWQLDRRRLSYGGLKDRHAQTIQHFTVFHGPERRLTHQGFSVTYVGKVAEPFHSEHVRANHFQLIVRDVSREERASFDIAFEEVQACGIPNYFDDQRFGSVTPKSAPAPEEAAGEVQFLAKSIILGRYEEALQLALTAYYPHDRAPQKKEKAILRKHWGDWARCKELLSKSHSRSLIDYLVGHPDDFKGALERLRPELRGLYLSAYQSHLWNRTLAAWLRASLHPEQLTNVALKLGDVPMQRSLAADEFEALRALRLPLASPKVILGKDDPRRPFFEQVLKEEGLSVDQFKLKGFQEMFFSRGDRAALCEPQNLQFTPNPDETHAGKQKLRLIFDLPRGSYATLLVKRLLASYVASESDSE